MFAKRLVAACATAAVLGLGGCADQQESLIVVGVGAWGPDGECVVDPATSTFLPFGILDLYCEDPNARCFSVSSSYYMGVIIESQLVQQSGVMTNTGTDPSELQLTDAEVTFRSPQLLSLRGGGALDEDTLRTFSPPLATDSIPGGERAGILVEVINAAQAEALYQAITGGNPDDFTEVTLEVSIFFVAERTGNGKGGAGEIESRHFTFPIKLCKGCLLSCETCPDGACPESDPNELEWTGGVCGNTQDGLLYPTICGM